MPICRVSILTISWLLSSICCLMPIMESIVKASILGEANLVPLGCVVGSELLIVNLKAAYRFKGDDIVALLSVYIDI